MSLLTTTAVLGHVVRYLALDERNATTDRHDGFISGMYRQNRGWPHLPQCCESLTISTKFNWHKKRLCSSECISQGTCPRLPSATVLRHVVVLKPSPLPQCWRNVVERLGRVLRCATFGRPTRSSPTLPYELWDIALLGGEWFGGGGPCITGSDNCWYGWLRLLSRCCWLNCKAPGRCLRRWLHGCSNSQWPIC